MAESEGTAGIDEDSLKGTDVLEGAEEREEDADGDEQAAEAGGGRATSSANRVGASRGPGRPRGG